MNHETIVHLGYPVAIANRIGRLCGIASCKLLFEPVARLVAMMLRQHHDSARSVERCAFCKWWFEIVEASWPNYNVPCWYKRNVFLDIFRPELLTMKLVCGSVSQEFLPYWLIIFGYDISVKLAVVFVCICVYAWVFLLNAAPFCSNLPLALVGSTLRFTYSDRLSFRPFRWEILAV